MQIWKSCKCLDVQDGNYAQASARVDTEKGSRPQFDNTAVAVIITKSEKVYKYEKMTSGEELLESWSVIMGGQVCFTDRYSLHLNLIDHLVYAPDILFSLEKI